MNDKKENEELNIPNDESDIAQGPSGQQSGPTVAWQGIDGIKTGPFAIRIIWSQSITRFGSSDISVSAGTIGNLKGVRDTNNTTFSATVTPPSSGSGTITITIRANGVVPTNTEQSVTYEYDNRSIATFSILTGTQRDTFTLSGSWDRNVSGFEESDVTLSTGTIANFSPGRNFSFDIIPPAESSGSILVTIPADRVSPGNAEASITILYDTTIPEYAYQNLPVVYRVFFQEIDITSDVLSIGNIDHSVDYPRITEYRIAELQLTLKYLDGRYHPENENNFFRTLTDAEGNNRPVSGYKVPVRVQAGFLLANGTEEIQTIFAGIINNISSNSKTGETSITCSDNSQDLRTKTLQDFGLEKRIRLTEGTPSGATGVYPIASAVTPVSEKSYSATTTTNTMMEIKENLDTEGILEPTNYNIENSELRTEGGALEDGQGDPVITFKAPYRNKSLRFLIEKILENYNISDYDFALPTVTRPNEYYASLGRPGYDTEKDDDNASPLWFWNGFVTDAIIYEDNIYFLYSGSRNTTSQSEIIRYDPKSEEFQVLYTANEHQEWWKLAGVDSNNNGFYDIFYVLGTQPQLTRDNRRDFTGVTTLGYYNSSIPNPGTNITYSRIWRINTGIGATQRVWVSNNDSLRPQLARHYTIGSSYKDHKSGDVPDSNQGFEIYDGNLYYRFANNTNFGIACIAINNDSTPGSPTALLTVNRDDNGFNSTNHDFTISDDTLYAAFTWISKNNTSRLKIVSKSL